MTLAKQVAISVVVLGIVGVAAYFGAVAVLSRLIIERVRVSKIGNSPIMASGGSMTFRSAGVEWTCDNPAGPSHTKCVTAKMVSVATIQWDNVLPIGTSAGSLGWTNLTIPWAFDIWARNPGGNVLKGTGGVKMCTTSTNTISATAPTCDALADMPQPYSSPAMSFVLLYVEGSNVASLSLKDSYAAESGTNALQYFDSSCTVHDPSMKIQACEHPGEIDSSIDKGKYRCVHGSCQITVDQ